MIERVWEKGCLFCWLSWEDLWLFYWFVDWCESFLILWMVRGVGKWVIVVLVCCLMWFFWKCWCWFGRFELNWKVCLVFDRCCVLLDLGILFCRKGVLVLVVSEKIDNCLFLCFLIVIGKCWFVLMIFVKLIWVLVDVCEFL